MIPLNSTCIEAVDFDYTTRVLSIRYCSGSEVYRFYQVPVKIFHGLLNATESHGDYYHSHIHGRFRHPGYPPIQSLKIGRSPFAIALAPTHTEDSIKQSNS